MAVQAALLNPHFMPFCYPDYQLLDKGYEDGGAPGSGESKEATRDLLSFIDSASSNIRVALDKPGKSKRKVNHRKYLQKQIKRCTGIISPAAGAAEPPKGQGQGQHLCRPPPKREPAQTSLQSRSLAALFDHPPSSSSEIRPEKGKKVPLRKRNLPPSFFTEPAHAVPAQGIALRELERCGAEAADFFELLGTDYSGLLSEQEVFQGASVRILPDLALEHPLCEQHPLLGGLVYPDGWGPYGVSRKSPTGLGLVMPGYPTSPDSGLSSPVEDSSPHLTQFAPFYPDCAPPPVAYDFTPGYNRAGYPAL